VYFLLKNYICYRERIEIQGVSELIANIDTATLGYENKSKMLMNICPISNGLEVIM